MKKLLLGLLAFAAVACTNDEVVKEDLSFITFGDSFVEIKTRGAIDPSITTASIDAFDVWAFISQPSGVVFDAERVTKGEKGWEYKNTQWWLPGNRYFFYAVAPVDNANIKVDTKEMNTLGLGNIDFTNENGSVDLLYTEKLIETGNDVLSNGPGKVMLQFHHMLSKVKFTFTNGFNNQNAHLAVKNVQISDAPANGNIDVNTDTWSWNVTPNQPVALRFGDVNGGNVFDVTVSHECAQERLTIPTDKTHIYTIEFDLELYYGDQLGHTSHKTIKLQNQAFEIGKNYNIKATITADNFDEKALKPIEFDVEVKEWIEGTVDGTIDWGKAPEPIATPVVSTKVESNVVTLSWEAVEGAKEYTVQVDDDVVEVVTGTTYTFEGDYEVKYTFTVKAIADGDKNLDSEAAVVTATTEAKPAVTYTTVEEFLAAPQAEDADITAGTAPLYTLKGTVTSVDDTLWGNFYITDETATVYIYGLCSPEGTKQYWGTSGVKVGDDIEIKTVRTAYGSNPQGKNATYVSHTTPGTIAFWSFDKTNVSFAAEGGEQTVNVAAYNLKEAVQVSSDNAHFTATYADGVLTIAAPANAASDKIEGVVTVTCGTLNQEVVVSQIAAGAKVAQEATLTFDDKSKRTTFTTSQQVWAQNDITFTNDKASSTNNVADYAQPVRLYQNSKITVDAPGEISLIVFDCNNSSYATALKNSIGAAATVSSDKVTVALDGTSSTFVVAKLTAQVRLDAVTVTYLK